MNDTDYARQIGQVPPRHLNWVGGCGVGRADVGLVESQGCEDRQTSARDM
jgi:hypothetical protein